MKKFASPNELVSELRSLLAYAEGHQPSREKLASGLRELAHRTAGYPRNFTLHRRMTAVLDEFLDQTKAAARQMESEADLRHIAWRSGPSGGFPWLIGTIYDREGRKHKFDFLPEEPHTAASEILYKIGGW